MKSPWPPVRNRTQEMVASEAENPAIVTSERLENMSCEKVRAYAHDKLGMTNTAEINGHAPGSLIAKSVQAHGGEVRWRLVIEWKEKTP